MGFKGMIESGMKESLNSTLALESFPEFGEKYDLEYLKVVAEQAMISSLTPENVISFFKAGQLLRGESIRASAKTFICRNIKNVSDKEKLRTELQGEEELLMELLESLIGM